MNELQAAAPREGILSAQRESYNFLYNKEAYNIYREIKPNLMFVREQ